MFEILISIIYFEISKCLKSIQCMNKYRLSEYRIEIQRLIQVELSYLWPLFIVLRGLYCLIHNDNA